jgi:hypothetical protein
LMRPLRVLPVMREQLPRWREGSGWSWSLLIYAS